MPHRTLKTRRAQLGRERKVIIINTYFVATLVLAAVGLTVALITLVVKIVELGRK